MDRGKRIIGYGICGPGEADRFMRETFEDFKRLCDRVVILVNDHANVGTMREKAMIYEFGFQMVQDHREWGRLQWKIKQDFIENHVAPLAREGDVMVCLDMDERFDRHITREWLISMPFDAYKVFVVDLWNDPQHYKPESCFWNTRIWRWNGITEWVAKPVHCGLAPKWAAAYNRYAPFILIHKGLMLKEDRARKIARYEKYDPHARHLAKPYYAMLHSDTAEPFDEEALHATIDSEVSTYKQTRPRALPPMAQPKGRFAYVENPGGMTVDIPEKQLAETLKRPGFKFIGWADEAEDELESMFGEESAPEGEGSYQRSAADEKAEVDQLNAGDDTAMFEESPRAAADALPPVDQSPIVNDRVGMKQHEEQRQEKIGKTPKTAPKKTAAKKPKK